MAEHMPPAGFPYSADIVVGTQALYPHEAINSATISNDSSLLP